MPSTSAGSPQVPRDMVRGTSLEPIRVGDAAGGRRDLLRRGLRRRHRRPGGARRRAGHRADQQRDVQPTPARSTQQFEISRLRALETGRWVVVAAINGDLRRRTPRRHRGGLGPGRAPRPCSSRTSASARRCTPAVRLGRVARTHSWCSSVVLHHAVVLVTVSSSPAARPRRPRPAAAPAARQPLAARYARVSVDGLGRCVMVVPTYNESENLAWIVGRLRAAQPGVDVLVVDDNCPDGTGDIADRLAAADPAVTVVHRTEKAGLGRRLPPRLRRRARRGLRRHRRDGRRRLPPARAAAPAARRPARRRPGDRLALGPGRVGGQLARPAPGCCRAAATSTSGCCSGSSVRDATAGFRVFRRATLEKIDLGSRAGHRLRLPDRPGLPHRARRPARREVPIEFIERVRGDSKMSGPVATESLRMITRWGLRRASTRSSRRSRVRA